VLHVVGADGVFVLDDSYVPEGKCFEGAFHQTVMRDGIVGVDGLVSEKSRNLMENPGSQ
jgi:hypothetical protein